MFGVLFVYLLIGLFVAFTAWIFDNSPLEAKRQAWPVLVLIVVLWPLWILFHLSLRAR